MLNKVFDPNAHVELLTSEVSIVATAGAYSLYESQYGLFAVHNATWESLALRALPSGLKACWESFTPTLRLSIDDIVSIEIEDDLNEELADEQVLKAVFLAGAGGSGKGQICKAMFAGTGFKIINQDNHLERFLKAAKIPLKDAGKNYGLFNAARDLKNAEIKQYGSRRLPVIIDSTGWEYSRIVDPAKKLRKLGYDCFMVFVTTSLETALRRNKARADAGGRDVPDSYVRDAHIGAHSNIEDYKKFFGRKRFFLIDNDKDVPEQTWASVITPKLRKIGNKILKAPIANPKGIEWMNKAATSGETGASTTEWPKDDPVPAKTIKSFDDLFSFKPKMAAPAPKTGFYKPSGSYKPVQGQHAPEKPVPVQSVPSAFELEKPKPPESDTTDFDLSFIDKFLAQKKAQKKQNESLLEGVGAPVKPDSNVPTETGFVYHATNLDNASDIVMGGLKVHKPNYGTDQDTWPDGSTEKRSYFTGTAAFAHSFAPDHGSPVLLRVPRSAAAFKSESGTKDVYATKTIPSKFVEILTTEGWVSLKTFFTKNESAEDVGIADDAHKIEMAIAEWLTDSDDTLEEFDQWLAYHYPDLVDPVTLMHANQFAQSVRSRMLTPIAD